MSTIEITEDDDNRGNVVAAPAVTVAPASVSIPLPLATATIPEPTPLAQRCRSKERNTLSRCIQVRGHAGDHAARIMDNGSSFYLYWGPLQPKPGKRGIPAFQQSAAVNAAVAATPKAPEGVFYPTATTTVADLGTAVADEPKPRAKAKPKGKRVVSRVPAKPKVRVQAKAKAKAKAKPAPAKPKRRAVVSAAAKRTRTRTRARAKARR